jgi:SAM-dependent methyltransferase
MNNKTEAGFKPESFKWLASKEDLSWWFRSRNKIILWAMRKFSSNPKSLLEIGCGTGYVLDAINKAFPSSTLHGDECYEEGLRFAKQRVPHASFRCLDALKMVDKDCYDVIGAFDVIEHIKDDKIVLQNCFLALKSKGHLFLTVPQHMWLWSHVDEDACHIRRYSKSEIIEKVQGSGFKVLVSTSFNSFLIPLMFLSRKNFFRKNSISRSELNISSWLNFIFESIMKIEIFLIQLGIRLPFGGSLILVAQKP